MLQKNVWQICYEDYPDAFIPEQWAQESLMQLEANMVAAGLVHRNFENQLQQFGDVVNTRKPAAFVSKRKTSSDSVTEQTVSADNVAVTLNQHQHVTFVIKDEDLSKSFMDLIPIYIQPAALAIAQALDEIVLTQVYQFIENNVGHLQAGGSLANLIAVREKMNVLKVPQENRLLFISPAVEADLLAIEGLTSAAWVNDQGAAIKNAYLGSRFGLNMFMCQNVPSIPAGSTYNDLTVSTTLNADAAAGATDISCTSVASVVAGQWCTVGTDMTPQLITAITSDNLTIWPGLKTAAASGQAVVVYEHASPDATTYAIGYAKAITLDAPAAIAAKKGQMITTGVSSAALKRYGAIGTPTLTSIWLDRPLETAIASTSTVIGLGPAGDYCFGLHPNAVALVVRPLATPPSGTGARSYVANYKGLAIRVTMGYDTTVQGLRVTLDLLCGVKVLDDDLGVPMLA